MTIVVALVATVMAGEPAAARTPANIDAIFADFTASTPGCAVAVDRTGQPPIARAYGSADLEHGAANQVDTVFEAGSVSKQFTAAAVLLLAQEGRLSLQDDVRKYIPELPDYGHPITLDELLSHTSGLRDWGDVESLGGWPRGDRIYSMADVLHVAARQRALNYAPGSAWSYTNTGYNLLATIVERVSGEALPAFTRERFFVPLGMSHTQWRDDFRRVVPGRAIAYVPGVAGYEQFMPFENAFGNGGLLTTVGDLLIWNRALGDAKLGPFVTTELQRQAKLNDGRETGYARGLFIRRYQGVPEVSHDGATAGYRAWLGRYPDQGLSIALLCNAGAANPDALAHGVASLYLPELQPAAGASAPPPSLAQWAGWYANDREGAPLHLVADGDRIRSEAGGRVLGPAPGGGTQLGSTPVTLRPDGKIEVGEAGDTVTYSRVEPFAPTQAELSQVVGHYRSAEADADYLITLDKDGLRLTVAERPDASFRLKPAYSDAFTYAAGIVRLVRGAGGSVGALRLSDSRVWDLSAQRVTADSAPR
jgi:CubicO group peptidase (beta-lactamase class C family)